MALFVFDEHGSADHEPAAPGTPPVVTGAAGVKHRRAARFTLDQGTRAGTDVVPSVASVNPPMGMPCLAGLIFNFLGGLGTWLPP
jgi:hypothetical protein